MNIIILVQQIHNIFDFDKIIIQLMQRRHNSVTKLPQISIKKKQSIVKACRKFDEEVKVVQQKQQTNIQTMSKFDFLYGSQKKSYMSKKSLLEDARGQLQKQIVLYDEKQKDQINDQRLKSSSLTKRIKIKIREKQQKQSQLLKIKLAQTKQFSYKTPQKLNLRELAEIQSVADAKTNSKRKKSAVVIVSERQKQVLPFYSVSQKKMIQISYTKMRQVTGGQKVKIRMANGIIKQVNRNTIYYKVGDAEQQQQQQHQKQQNDELEQQIKNCQINIDYTLLNQIMGRLNKQIPQTRKKQLMQDLIQNYKMSVNIFNNNWKKPGWLKNKIKHMNALTLQRSMVNFLETNLVCSVELQFLNIFNLDKRNYLYLLVQAENYVRSLEEFIHFDIFEMITILNNQGLNNMPSPQNNQNKQDSEQQKSNQQATKDKQPQSLKPQKQQQLNPAQHYKASKLITSQNIDTHLRNKRSQIQLKIYAIEQHIQKIKQILYKDIEHVIKLNPKLVGTPYQEYTRVFINKFSNFLGIVLRSVLSRAVYQQLQKLGNYYLEYFDVQFNGVLTANHPNTQFYSCITKINKPFITPFSKMKILNGPILIMLDVKIKKMKRKTLRNVYKFLIDSRKQIRAYPQKINQNNQGKKKDHRQSSLHQLQNTNPNLLNKQRIYFNNSYEILKTHLLEPIQKYIQNYLSTSQNINGCISDINLNIHRYGEFENFVKKIKLLSQKIQQTVILKYQQYFSYWELYLMERPYIEEMVTLFKRINGIRLMQDQMRNLESDLKIIREFPNVIEDKVVRIDISSIKQKIISTITINIKQIGKASEQVLQRLLSIGQAETLKARKLNQITPYSTIAEYINFAKALSSRGVQRSIQRVALNAVVLTQNWNFLQQNNFTVRMKTMGQYLESCIWVRMLRKAANANRMKLTVDPQIFSNGVIQKKYKIYYKYMFLVKQIAEVIKLTEVAHWDRYSALSKNIYSQLKDIVKIAKDISQQEDLLRIQYYDDSKEKLENQSKTEEGKEVMKIQKAPVTSYHKPRAGFKQNFIFFLKEEVYISKFAKFWQYTIKFKNQVEDFSRLTLYEIHGENILKVIRQGQQILHELKITSVNKRLLGLVQKLYKEMELYVKHSRVIKVLCNGSESARTRALVELKKQIADHIQRKKKQIQERKRKAEEEQLKKYLQNAAENQEAESNAVEIPTKEEPNLQNKEKQDQKKVELVDQDQFQTATLNILQSFLKSEQMYITLKQLIETPLPALDFTPFYQMYMAERRKQQVMAKVKKISHQIKLLDVKIITISIVSPLPSVEFLQIPPNLLHYVSEENRQMLEIITQMTQKAQEPAVHQLLQVYEEYYKEAQNCSKKLSIFNSSLQKMKKVQSYMYELYSWFQLILPSLMPASSNLLSQFKPFYQQFSLQYNKKLQIIKKLGYVNLYEDRVRINYDKELEKFEQMKIKLYNHPTFGMMILNKNHNYCCINSVQHLFSYFGSLSAVLVKAQDAQNQKKVQDTLKSLDKQTYNRKTPHLNYCLPNGLQNLSFILQYNQKQKCFYIRGNRISTVHHQQLSFNDPVQAPSADKSKPNKKPTQKLIIKQQKLFTVQLSQQNKEPQPQSQPDQQPRSQTYTCQSGILTIIDNISKSIQSSLQNQILQLLPIVYQFHYNIKDLFTMYITLGNCLFQTLITSLYTVFYMDLLLVWENDYDILVLKEKIRDCYQNGFQAKQSENNRLVEEIYKCYEIFTGIIDMIVRRKSQQTDREIQGPNIEIEKIRKKLIIQFIPVLMFEQFQSPKNRKRNREWLLLIKKDKQDDFINQTHLNPAFQQIMDELVFNNERVREIMDKIQIKEIQKKDQMLISKLGDSIFSNIPITSATTKISRKNVSKQSGKLVVMGYSNFKVSYGYQIIKSISNIIDNTQACLNATWLITQAQRHGKILITNCHPNSHILGRNIITRWIKLCKNKTSSISDKKLLQTLSKPPKKQPQIQQKDDTKSIISNSSLKNSIISIQTAQIQHKQTTTLKKQPTNLTSTNIHEQDQSTQLINSGEMLNQYAKNIMNQICYNCSYCYCVYVGDQESLGWVIQYLVGLGEEIRLENQKIQQQQKYRQMPLVYIYCMEIDTQYLQKHPNLQQCLVYIKDYQAYSNAVINTNYSQNRLFTHKTTVHKDSLGAKLKDVLGPQSSNNNNSANQGTSAFLPLSSYLHTNPLLLHYNSLYPYSTIITGTKIYQNTLSYPILINQSSSPNILRNPMNPKYRQLIHKNIINFYSSLKIQQYLQLPLMQPIVHSLHYNAIIIPSSNTSDSGLNNNYTKYIVNVQIKEVMCRVWYLVMEEINRMQLGQPISSSITNTEITNVDLYVIPVHAMTVGQLIGSMVCNVNQQNGSYHRVPKQGTIQTILKLAVMATNLVSGDKSPTPIHSTPTTQKHDPILQSLNQYLIHTHSDPHPQNHHHPNTHHPQPQPQTNLNHILPTCRWFILDLSVYNDTSIEIYKWLCGSFIQNCFVFLNQNTVYWNHNASMRVGYAKKNQYNSSHGTANLFNLYLVKILVIVHPKLMEVGTRGGLGMLEPLPVVDLISNYNPILQISQQVPKLLNLLRTPSTNIPQTPQILQLITKILLYTPQQPSTQKSLYNKLTPTKTQHFLIKLHILINQLRKCRLANGLYIQTEVNQHDKKQILMCSIQLRQKIKSSYQAMTEMLEIQKELDGERKDMYKMYVGIFNAEINVHSTQGRQLAFNPNYLNIDNLKKHIKQNPLSKTLQASCDKNLKILDQKLIADIGFDTIAKIIVQGLYATFSAYCTTRQQRQELSKQILSVLTVKTGEQTKQSPKKKVNKKMARNKKTDNIGTTINHPNLLGLPTIHSSATMPTPTPFNLLDYFYNISTDTWQKWHQLSPLLLLPTKQNCSTNTHKQALHPAQILRLNPYINIGVKQSILKNYCNAGGIPYDMNVVKNYVDQDILWFRYLVVYGVMATVIRVRDDSDRSNSMNSYSNTHFINHITHKSTIPKNTQLIQLTINKNNSIIQNWLQTKHETILNYHMNNHYKLSTAAFATIRENQFRRVSQDIGIFGNQWYCVNDRSCVNGRKIFVFDVVKEVDQQVSEVAIRAMKQYCIGIPILNIQTNPNLTQQQITTISIINPILQTYLKYKNITNITQLLLTHQTTSTSTKNKSKTSTNQTKHHSHTPTLQQHNQYKKQFSLFSQIHLQRLLTLINIYTVYQQPKFYERILRILLQIVPQENNQNIISNRYYPELDLYGIKVDADRADELYDIYWKIVTTIREEKLMRNHMLMNSNNPISMANDTNAIEEFRAKADQAIGVEFYKYFINSPKIVYEDSGFYKYVPRYLLPKPKKYKTSSLIINQAYLAGNGYFAQMIKLQDLQTLSTNQSQQKQKQQNPDSNPKLQQTNQTYYQNFHKIEHSYTGIYQLNQKIIITVITDQQYDVGNINVEYFMTGFLLYTKSRIFVQSQLMAGSQDGGIVFSQNKGNVLDLHHNSLYYLNIDKGVAGYNKQFSLSDAKVSKIVNQYWRSQRKPYIRIIYKCLYSINGDQYQQQIKWISELDANNNHTYTYTQQKHSNPMSTSQSPSNPQTKKLNYVTTRRPKTKQKNNIKSNTSYSRSMMSNLSQDHDNVMGILTFIQVVNQGISVKDVLGVFQGGVGNQFIVVLVHGGEDVGMDMKEKLGGYFWLVHRPVLSNMSNQQSNPQNKLSPSQTIPPHLTTIHQKKYTQILTKLSQLHKTKFTNYYIPEGVIGKVYIPAIAKKRQQIKDVILQKKQERAAKKQVYDNCVLDIQTLRNKIQESQVTIRSNTEKIGEWVGLLGDFSAKLERYVGEKQYYQAKQKILEIPRKIIQKQVLKSAYIEDNPLNLSYLYRFNVLADNTYFPDKNFQVYEHVYKITGKYAVFQEQKKQFIKLFNMGRLNIMLENDDYWPNQDQIVSSQKIRKQFEYIGSIKINNPDQKQPKQSFSLTNLLIKQQLKFISQKTQTPIQQTFHRYLAYLSAHSYVKHYLTSNKQKLQKNIKDCQQQSKILTNKIKDYKLMLKQQQDKQVSYKSKYDRAIEEVQYCQENQRIFVEIGLKNVAKLSQILEYNVFGVKGMEKEKVVEEIAGFLVYGISRYCQECLRISKLSQSQQNRIYHPLSIEARRYLFYLVGINTIKTKVLSYKTESVSSLYDNLYVHLLKQELKIENNLIFHECDHYKQENYKKRVDDRHFNIVSHTKNQQNIIRQQQLQNIIASEIFPEFAQQPTNLLRKLQRIQNLLQNSFHKFVQKIDLIQSKQLQSIRKFEIKDDMVITVLEGFKNQTLQFQGLDYLGDWKIRNKSQAQLCATFAKYLSNQQIIKQLISKLHLPQQYFQTIYTPQSLKYYCRLLGQTIRRTNQIQTLISTTQTIKTTLFTLIKQFIYNHSSLNIKNIIPQNKLKISEDIIDEQILHKQSLEKLGGVGEEGVVNQLCFLDSILVLNWGIVFIQADPGLQSMLVRKAQKNNYKIIWKQIKFTDQQKNNKNKQQKIQPSSQQDKIDQSQQKADQQQINTQKQSSSSQSFQYFHYIQDTTAQHWIIYYIYNRTFSQLNQIKQNYLKLEDDIKRMGQQNTKYMFILRNREVIDYIENLVQPVYRIYANNNFFARLRYEQYRNKAKIDDFQNKQHVKERNSVQLGIQLVGKLFEYYSSAIFKHSNWPHTTQKQNFLHLFTKNTQPLKPQPLEQPKPKTEQTPLQPQAQPQQDEQKLINQTRTLYPRPQCIPMLYRLLQSNPLVTSSSLEYRMLKKIIGLLFVDDENTFQVLQGYQIFQSYFCGDLGQAKYRDDYTRIAVEEVHRSRKIQEIVEQNKTEQEELNQEQIQKNIQISKMKRRYQKFIHFIENAHEKCCVELTSSFQKSSHKLQRELILTQDFLNQAHLIQNKTAFSTKIKDPTEQIIKSLFVKSNSKIANQQSKAMKSSLNQIKNNESLLLADPKIYIILNKTLKKALNKVAIAKQTKKGSLGSKEGKVKRKLLPNAKQAHKMLSSQSFLSVFEPIASLHRIQFLMWMFSESENIKMNNICFSVKHKTMNEFELTGSDEEKQIDSPKQKIQQFLDQKLKSISLGHCFKFQLRCVNADELLLPGAEIKLGQIQQLSSCQVQVQIVPVELNKVNRPYRGLLFKYENEPKQIEDFNYSFKNASGMREDQFLKPGPMLGIEQSREGSSPSISKQEAGSESPSSPMTRMTRNRKATAMMGQTLKQSDNLSKLSYFILPVYCNRVQIGVLEIDLRLCKGFDPVRSYAILK